MTGTAWIAFVAAAAIGAPARYLVEGIVQERTGGRLPWGTLVVNVSGCFVLGLLTGFGLYHGLDTTPRVVLGTAGLGAYTTFSTFTFQSVSLLEQRVRHVPPQQTSLPASCSASPPPASGWPWRPSCDPRVTPHP